MATLMTIRLVTGPTATEPAYMRVTAADAPMLRSGLNAVEAEAAAEAYLGLDDAPPRIARSPCG